MTWNATPITGPVLIYQDELIVNDTGVSGSDKTVSLNANGSLVCRYEGRGTVGWRTPNKIAEHRRFAFRQIRTENENPSVSRLSITRAGVARNDPNSNGLWTCRRSGSDNTIHVGLFGRGQGKWLYMYI